MWVSDEEKSNYREGGEKEKIKEEIRRGEEHMLCTLYASHHVRRKLPLPREPAGAIPKEGTNLYWVAKLQGAVERQYTLTLVW
jgi:hypothetical protein